MSKYNFAVCTVNIRYDSAMARDMRTVEKPLQLFETQEDAEEAMEVMDGFYDYNLAVVHVLNLNDTFQ